MHAHILFWWYYIPVWIACLCVYVLFFLFFFWSVVLNFCGCDGFPVGPIHYSRDSQASFFTKTFIKNGSYSTIHKFKNYFVTVFLVFSKINGIQSHLTCDPPLVIILFHSLTFQSKLHKSTNLFAWAKGRSLNFRFKNGATCFYFESKNLGWICNFISGSHWVIESKSTFPTSKISVWFLNLCFLFFE